MSSVQEIINNLRNVDPSRVAGINAVILFDLTGEGGGKWTVKIADGKVDVDEGATDTPNMTLSMSSTDFQAMTRGELNAVNAFMQGKIKVSGDMSLAMRLQSILS